MPVPQNVLDALNDLQSKIDSQSALIVAETAATQALAAAQTAASLATQARANSGGAIQASLDALTVLLQADIADNDLTTTTPPPEDSTPTTLPPGENS